MTTEQIIAAARWTTFIWAWESLVKALVTPYSVTICGSDPDADDFDDAWTGEDYATSAEARAAFTATLNDTAGGVIASEHEVYYSNWSHIMLDGPDVHLVAKNPRFDAKRRERDRRESDAEWRSERAHQAGMAFGCDGYNDEMGY